MAPNTQRVSVAINRKKKIKTGSQFCHTKRCTLLTANSQSQGRLSSDRSHCFCRWDIGRLQRLRSKTFRIKHDLLHLGVIMAGLAWAQLRCAPLFADCVVMRCLPGQDLGPSLCLPPNTPGDLKKGRQCTKYSVRRSNLLKCAMDAAAQPHYRYRRRSRYSKRFGRATCPPTSLLFSG